MDGANTAVEMLTQMWEADTHRLLLVKLLHIYKWVTVYIGRFPVSSSWLNAMCHWKGSTICLVLAVLSHILCDFSITNLSLIGTLEANKPVFWVH